MILDKVVLLELKKKKILDKVILDFLLFYYLLSPSQIISHHLQYQ